MLKTTCARDVATCMLTARMALASASPAGRCGSSCHKHSRSARCCRAKSAKSTTATSAACRRKLVRAAIDAAAHSLCERRTHSQHWAAAAVLHRKLRVNIASSCSAPVFLKQCDFTTSARSKWRSTIARPTTAACCCGPTSFWTLVRITSLLQLSQFSLRTCFLPGAAIDNQLRDAIIGLHEDAGNANVTGPLNFAAATAFIVSKQSCCSLTLVLLASWNTVQASISCLAKVSTARLRWRTLRCSDSRARNGVRVALLIFAALLATS